MNKVIASILTLGLIASAGSLVATEAYAKAHGNGTNPDSSVNGGDGGNVSKNAARGGGPRDRGNGGNSANAPGADQGQSPGGK